MGGNLSHLFHERICRAKRQKNQMNVFFSPFKILKRLGQAWLDLEPWGLIIQKKNISSSYSVSILLPGMKIFPSFYIKKSTYKKTRSRWDGDKCPAPCQVQGRRIVSLEPTTSSTAAPLKDVSLKNFFWLKAFFSSLRFDQGETWKKKKFVVVMMVSIWRYLESCW